MSQPTGSPPPAYRVTADGLIHGHPVPPITILAPASGEEIANAVYAALINIRDETGVDIDVDINLGTGTGVIRLEGDEIPLTVTGPGATSPGGWPQELAAELRRVADQIATLPADTPRPQYPSVDLTGSYDPRDAARMKPLVDTIVAALDLPAAKTEKISGNTYYYESRARRGLLDIQVMTKAPAPEDPELAALRARVAELEAQQSGGAQ